MAQDRHVGSNERWKKRSARSIQLRTLINNSGGEMPQYRAQRRLKIEHAPMPEERGENQREVA